MRYFLIALMAAAFAFPAMSEEEPRNTTTPPSETGAFDHKPAPTPVAAPQTVGYDAKAARDANGNIIPAAKSATVTEEKPALRNDYNLRSDRDLLNKK